MNLQTPPLDKKVIIMLFLAVAFFVTCSVYFIGRVFVKTEADAVDKENPKLAEIFEASVALQVIKYSPGRCDGCIPTAKDRVREVMKEIKEIRTYVAHSVNTPHPFNAKYIDISYVDGQKAEGIRLVSGSKHHGFFPYPYLYPVLLLRFQFENGVVTKAFTNGVERKFSPKDISFNTEVEALTSQDAREHPEKYYKYYQNPPKEKTKEDIADEWKK